MNSDVVGYFTKLKWLWYELDLLNLNVCYIAVCFCEGKTKLSKSLKDQRLIQLLMELSYAFAQTRGHLDGESCSKHGSCLFTIIRRKNHKKIRVNSNCTFDFVSFMSTTQESYYPNNENQPFKGSSTV